ncbi:MAG: pantetheine-phosphate adenylyltransferase [Eubacterium sp.]
MRIAVYPGSFDPVTFGHLDIIERASKIFDKVIICVMVNHKKKYLFSVEERCKLIKESIKHLSNVEIDFSSELLIDYVRSKNANIRLKGLRGHQDFEFELQMAFTNKKLDDEIETFFIMTNNKYSFVSSSVVKELMEFDGDVSCFIPPHVEKALQIKYGKDSIQ